MRQDNQKHRRRLRRHPIGSVFLIILYHKYLSIFHMYIYIYLYILNMLNMFFCFRFLYFSFLFFKSCSFVRFLLFERFLGSSTQNHAESFGNHPQKSFLYPKQAKLKKKFKSMCKKWFKSIGNRPEPKKLKFSGDGLSTIKNRRLPQRDHYID